MIAFPRPYIDVTALAVGFSRLKAASIVDTVGGSGVGRSPDAEVASAADMPAEPTQALRFERTRTARSTTLQEDYVELIADLHAAHGEARATDVARRLGVTHPTALKCIGRLKREGLVTARPYRGLFLTAVGKELADRVRARHRLVVDFLVAVGVPGEVAEMDAEGMEHYASEVTLEAFTQFLKSRSKTKRV